MNKVIIIGGGIAGLTAAYQLSKQPDIKVIVLEASDRTGGRIMSAELKDRSVDLGGFILTQGYKNTLKLLKELKLESSFRKFEYFTELVWNSSAQEFLNIGANKLSFTDSLKRVSKILPFILKGKVNFYRPDMSFADGMTIHEFFSELLDNKDVVEVYDLLLQGYTYASPRKIPMALILPFIIKLVFSYTNSATILNGNTQILPDTLRDRIIANGGEILLSNTVKSINAGNVITEKSQFYADRVVLATTVEQELFTKILETEIDINYTNFYCAFVKFDKNVKLGEFDKWSAVYMPTFEEGNSIASMYNMNCISSKYSADIIGIYIKSDSQTTLSNSELLELINEKLKDKLPNNSAVEIKSLNHWKQCMPVMNKETLELIRDRQGKNNVFFAGDYLGFPTIETALSSGLRAAEGVIKSFQNKNNTSKSY